MYTATIYVPLKGLDVKPLWLNPYTFEELDSAYPLNIEELHRMVVHYIENYDDQTHSLRIESIL